MKALRILANTNKTLIPFALKDFGIPKINMNANNAHTYFENFFVCLHTQYVVIPCFSPNTEK
jgi:hypothetical protein